MDKKITKLQVKFMIEEDIKKTESIEELRCTNLYLVGLISGYELANGVDEKGYNELISYLDRLFHSKEKTLPIEDEKNK